MKKFVFFRHVPSFQSEEVDGVLVEMVQWQNGGGGILSISEGTENSAMIDIKNDHLDNVISVLKEYRRMVRQDQDGHEETFDDAD